MRIKNLPSIESMDGSQDALVIEQTDGSEDKSRKVSPAQIKQYVLNDMDEVPTQDSENPVMSGGVFSTMAVPKYDSANRREYYEGGAAFDGNIDSAPTAGSNNAVASGGTKTYVDNKIAVETITINNSTSIAANSYEQFSFNITKTGYTPIGIIDFLYTGGAGLTVSRFYVDSASIAIMHLYNTKSSAYTPTTLVIKVLYVKD